MEVALVENRQDYVHDEHRDQHQDRQIGNRVLENQSFTLQGSLKTRRKNLLRSLFDELSCRPDGISGFQVEKHGHAGELIDVVDRLWPDQQTRTGHRIEGNHPLPVIALDVELAQVFGSGTLIIGDLQNYLILIRRLLNEVAVVLRIGGVQKGENTRLRHPVELRLIAENIDLQVRRVV